MSTLPDWWVRIERSTGEVTVFGPYPDVAAAVWAAQESLLIEGECEEDAYDCWASFEPPQPDEVCVIVDLTNPHHTGRAS